MTSTKLPARNLAMTPRSKWPNIDADRLIAKERRMSENAEATAVASFSPCPTCRQYSHSIGEAQHNQADIERKSVVEGKRVSVRVESGGRGSIKKKKKKG